MNLRSSMMNLGNRDLAQFFPQQGAGLDPPVIVGQGELLVGAVRVVVFESPAEQQVSTPRISRNRVTMGIEPPSRMKTGRRPNPRSIAAEAAATKGLSRGTRTPGAPCISSNSMRMPAGQSDSRKGRSAAATLRGILPRHEPKAEFGPGPTRQDGLAPLALISAPQPVDVESGAGPAAFERREPPLAAQVRHADLPHEFLFVKRQRRELGPLPLRQRNDVIIESGHLNPAVRVDQLRRGSVPARWRG